MVAYPGVAQIRAHPRRDTSWQDRAACVDANPRIFFDAERYADALAVCAGCSVREPCRQFKRPSDEGVWGGQVHKRRRKAVNA